jgi:hypothetical protein
MIVASAIRNCLLGLWIQSEERNSDSSSGGQTLIISDTRDFTVNLSSKLIRQHHDDTIGGGKSGQGTMEAEGSKFLETVNQVTDYEVDRLRETTKLDKL